MSHVVEFYRCRSCWTLKVVDLERDPAANTLEYIPCAACLGKHGYAKLIPPPTPAGPDKWLVED